MNNMKIEAKRRLFSTNLGDLGGALELIRNMLSVDYPDVDVAYCSTTSGFNVSVTGWGDWENHELSSASEDKLRKLLDEVKSKYRSVDLSFFTENEPYIHIVIG